MLSGPWSACVNDAIARLIQPLLGAASKIHASAPMNDGVTNAAVMSARRPLRPGRSVRAISHASGVPISAAIVATDAASTNELMIGRR